MDTHAVINALFSVTLQQLQYERGPRQYPVTVKFIYTQKKDLRILNIGAYFTKLLMYKICVCNLVKRPSVLNINLTEMYNFAV